MIQDLNLIELQRVLNSSETSRDEKTEAAAEIHSRTPEPVALSKLNEYCRQFNELNRYDSRGTQNNLCDLIESIMSLDDLTDKQIEIARYSHPEIETYYKGELI